MSYALKKNVNGVYWHFLSFVYIHSGNLVKRLQGVLNRRCIPNPFIGDGLSFEFCFLFIYYFFPDFEKQQHFFARVFVVAFKVFVLSTV